jgi:deoxycytidine triphosphate deaminase
LLTEFDAPKENECKDKGSLVQPCSIDLHIGEIFQPGVKPGKPGSAGNPKSELVLRTGQTAIVATKESIHLPGDYAGFGFPPSHVSARALLMTNPGHIDPGYSGQLQFTVINMGREEYVLRRRDPIVTLLIFKLAVAVDADYATRHPSTATFAIEQRNIDRLSPDFVDVQKRATHIARKTLGYTTVGATILAIFLGWAFNAIDKRLEGIDDMKGRLTRVEDLNTSLAKELQNTREQLEKRIELDHRLAIVESQNKPKGALK